MDSKSSREGLMRLSAVGSGAASEKGLYDWSNSFFEIQGMRQEEEMLTAKCEERQQILELLNQRKDKVLREMSKTNEQHLGHNVFLQSKDVEQMFKKAERKTNEVLLMEAERQRLTQEFVQLQQRMSELQLQVLKYSVYQDFLEQVVRLSTFNDVREQVDHFESLLNFRDQLSQRDDQEQVNQLRTELMTLEDQNHLIMVHRSNQLSQLQSELERTRSEAFLWEQKWNHIEETAAKKTLLLGKIKLATLNLHEMTVIAVDNGEERVDVSDTETQLEKIKEFIQDHNDIVNQ